MKKIFSAFCLAFILSTVLQCQNVSSPSFPKRFGVTTERLAKLDAMAKSYFESGLFNGSILVALDGKVVFEKGYGYANMEWEIPNNGETKFDLASLSKQFTATAIMILVGEGKLDLDAPVSSYLPSFTNKIYAAITTRQLLSHTSGLPTNLFSPIARSDDDIWSKVELRHVLNDLELCHEPGARFQYSNCGYDVLSFIVEQISGMDFAGFLRARIFLPVGMKDTGFQNDGEILKGSASGYINIEGEWRRMRRPNSSMFVRGAGRVYSTVRDLFKWDEALKNHRVLSEKNTALLFTNNKMNYGFGWVLTPITLGTNKEVFQRTWHTGNGPGTSAIMMRFPDDGLLAVCLSNMQRAQTDNLCVELVRILHDGEIRYPKPSLDAALMATLFKQGLDSAFNLYISELKGSTYQMTGPMGLNNLAYKYLGNDCKEKALDVFRLFVKLYPTATIAYEGYAEALYLSGSRELAIENYRKAVELEFRNFPAVQALKFLKVDNPRQIANPMLLEILLHGPERAFTKFQSTPQADMALDEAYINGVGYNHLRNNLLADAIKFFEFNVKRFPTSANAYDSLAEAYMKNGQKKLAIVNYEKSLSLNPENVNARNMLVRLKEETS